MRKRIAITLLTLTLCPFGALAEQGYTINEVHDQADRLLEINGSVGTVEIETAKGRFNVSIEIPDVSRVPVLKITFPSLDQVPSQSENGKVTTHTYDYNSNSYLTNWVVDVDSTKLYGDYVKNTHRVGQYGMDAHADGSPLTMEESITFAEQILSSYKDQYGWDFAPHSFWSNSRRYKATAEKNKFIPDLNQPVDETGYYSLEYNQMFYGIPYYDYVRFTYPSKNDRQAPICLGTIHFDIFSPDCYSYYIYPSLENTVLAEDVPLCSLERVIETLKDSCKYRPEPPDKLRFVYMSMNDPDDRNGDLILIPAWILESDGGPERGIGWIAIVHAQTGQLIDTDKKDKDGHRTDATWFGWEKAN